MSKNKIENNPHYQSGYFWGKNMGRHIKDTEYKTLETFDPKATQSIITLVKDKDAHFVGGQADTMVVNYLTGKVEIDMYIKEEKQSKY